MNTELENDSIAYESTHRRDGREIFNMDWLDSLEFKEEHQETEDTGYPEKDSERKRKHNQGEKGRGERMRTNQSSKFFLPCCELAGGKKWVIGIGVARLDGRSFFPA